MAKSKLQIVEMENFRGADLLIPCCPYCGKKAVEVDEDGAGELNPCPHLEFIRAGDSDDFEYRSDGFAKAWDSLPEDSKWNWDEETLNKCIYGDGLIVFEVTNSGIACGPVSSTDHYGYVLVDTEEE